MLKPFLLAVALLSAAFAADALLSHAKADTTWQFADGDRLSTSCYYGAYGWQCRSWWNGTGNAARVVHVPANMEFNTNPAWGRGCRSCADVSK
jgi:hypothetical protein